MLLQRVGAPSFFLQHSVPLYKRTSFLIHSSTDGHLGCFQHLAIVNCAAMNIGMHRLFWIGVSGLLGYNPNNGIAGSKGSSIFNFLRIISSILFASSSYDCLLLKNLLHRLCFPTGSLDLPYHRLFLQCAIDTPRRTYIPSSSIWVSLQLQKQRRYVPS